MIYDIFYVSRNTISDQNFESFRKRFPLSQKVENLKSFDELKQKSLTKFFWIVWDDIVVNEDFDFDYRVSKWDEKYIHVFKNENFYDGIILYSKDHTVTKKEFDHRYFVEKKEIDITASKPKSFDIIFISYNESNADENFEKLKLKFPSVKRVDKIKGIHQAHLEAAKLSETDMFWVVDGDAQIEENFNFTTEYYPHYDAGNRERFLKTVKIYHSKNPVNELEYGYGGVKLLPKDLTMNMKLDTTDMTTSISKSLEIVPVVSNYTMFNTDPFNAWKSAFRECAKLSSKVIDRSYDEETEKRLEVWCTVGHDKPFGEYCINGAIAGKKYGYRYIGNSLRLALINDFEWLKQRFEEDCG